MEWLRLYDDVLDDPKVQRLSSRMFRHWVQLLCLANKGSVRGRIPKDIEAIAFRLRVRKTDAVLTLSTLLSLQLLVETSTDYIPHNWDERQKKSDSSAQRVASHRAKQGEDFSPGNVTEPLQKRDSNALDTETETEQNRTETEESAPAARADLVEIQFQDQFWKRWPKGRGSRKVSLDQWRRMKVKDREACLAVLPEFLACWAWRKEGGRFVKYAEGWLKNRGWEDDVPPDVEPLFSLNGRDINANIVQPGAGEEVDPAERDRLRRIRSAALAREREQLGTPEERWLRKKHDDARSAIPKS